MAQLHYSDQEARRQVADVDQYDEAVRLQGEGYGDPKKNFNSSPRRSSEAPIMEVHHNRNDPISSDQSSVSSGYGKLDHPMPEDAGKASPPSGYGGLQLDEVAGKPKDEGYTSLGIGDSVDENNSDRSLGGPSEEGNYMKERGGATPESMAKELEDHHPAAEEGIIDVNSLKDNYLDLSDGNTNQLEVVNDPGLEPNQVDFSKDNTDDLKVNDPALEPNSADTAQLTSQIKCPDDDPKQEQTVAAPCPSPDDHDNTGCESFQGDDGREKIKVESFNVYSGEPESSVYDTADVLGDQHESERTTADYNDVRGSQDPVANEDRSHDQAKLEVQLQDFDTTRRRDEQSSGDFGATRGDEPWKPRSGVHDQLQDEIPAQEQRTSGVEEREDEKATIAQYKGDDQIDVGGDVWNDVRGDVRNGDQPQIDIRGDAVQNRDQPQDDDAIFKPSEDVGGQEDLSAKVMPDEEVLPTIAQDKGDDQFDVDGDVWNDVRGDAQNRDQPQIDVRGGVQNCDQPQDDDAFKPSADVGGQEDSPPKVMPDEKVLPTVAQDKGDDQFDEGGDVWKDVRSDVWNHDQPQIDVRGDVQNREQPQDHDAFKPSEDVGVQEDSSSKVMPDEEVLPTVAQDKGDDQFDVGANVEDSSPKVMLNEEVLPTVAQDKGDDQFDVGGEGWNDIRGDVRNRDQPQIDVRGEVQNRNQPQDENAFKPYEDVGGQEDSSRKVMPDEEMLPAREDFSEANTKDNLEEQFTEHISSPVEQDAGLKVDREVDSELVNKDGSDSSDRRNIECANANVNAESPYTEFDRTEDYVKAAYGGEGFVPKHNEEVDRESREEPTEKVGQEEERRRTDEHPLDKSVELENMAKGEGSEDIGKRASAGGIEYGKDGGGMEDRQIEYPDVPPPQPDVYVRPPSLPHPQPQDLAETNSNNYPNNGNSTYEEQKPPEFHHEAPHKKGVFEKIKEKLTPPFSSD